MRTRFRAINYFTSFIPDFLHLPISRFPYDPLFPDELGSVLLLRCCFDCQSNLSRQLNGLPIEDSLRKFLTDVLPHDIKLGEGDFSKDDCRDDDDGCRIRIGSTDLLFLERFVTAWLPLARRTVDVEELIVQAVHIEGLSFNQNENEPHYSYTSRNHNALRATIKGESQDKKSKVSDGTYANPTVIVEFEVPEPSQSLQFDYAFEREKIVVMEEASKCGDNMEMLQPLPASLPIHEIQHTLFSVEDIQKEYVAEVEVIPENDYMSPGRYHLDACSIPLLELGEINMGVFSIRSMEEEPHSYFENLDTAHGVENDESELNCQGLMGFKKIDLLDQISNQGLDLAPVNDFFCISEASCEENIRVVDLILLDAASAFLDEPVPYEEFKMLDSETSCIFHTISSLQISVEIETSKGLILESMNFKSFDDLIVCRELAPVDGLFRSLPVPAVDYYYKDPSPHETCTAVLTRLETIPISASDEIYLDWDFVRMDKYKYDGEDQFQKMLHIVDPHVLYCDQVYAQGSCALIDLVISSENANEQMCAEKKLIMFPGDSSILIDQSLAEVPHSMMDGDHRIGEDNKKSAVCHYPVHSMSTKTRSGFSDLDFFVDSRKSEGVLKGSHGIKSLKAGSSLLEIVGKDKIQTSAPTTTQKPQWDIKVHQVILPENIVELIESFVKSYLAIINDLNLKGMNLSNLVAAGANLLSFPEEKLFEYMKRSVEDKSFIGHGNDNALAFGALCTIKRMAWFLCLYGIHALYHFVGKLLQGLSCLKPKLGVLQSYIEDARQLADKEITKSHPSLALIQELLTLHSDEQTRVLIVADQELWCPLKRILAYLNKSVIDEQDLPDTSNLGSFSGTKMSRVLHSACLLMSPKNVSPSILLKEFHTILEYGGGCGSSKVSTLLPKASSSLNLHFLNLELDGAAALLCTGVNDLVNDTFTMQLEESLRSVEKGNLLSTEAEGDVPSCVPQSPSYVPVGVELHQPAEPSFTDKVIIVNTQDFDTEMIFSRRSTYQRILALEKEGAQVLERDFSIPIDIIISPSACLVWYDCKNIGKKATASDEGSSCVPLCVDNIAADVLTSVSFYFSRCILVFEGESSFLTTVMESSHELYAAAASLGIELQIFCAYSADLTEEIVLDSIGFVTRSCKGLYLKFPESETLAESFLTKFPSINPLSALSFLSTGEMLTDLIYWAEDWKLRALKKFNVADESISLFHALCRLGNREDSASGLTDCSSSMSSAPKLEGSDYKLREERRKRKLDESTSRGGRDHFKQTESANSIENYLYNTTMARISRDSGKGLLSDQSFNHQHFSYQHGSDDQLKMNLPAVSIPHSAWNDGCFGHKQRYGATTHTKLDRYGNHMFQFPKEDLMGEIVDDSLLCQDFSSHIKAMDVSPTGYEKEEVLGLEYSRSIRNLSFDQEPRPSFSVEAEGIVRPGMNNDFHDLYNDIDQISSKHVKNHLTLREGMLEPSAPSFHAMFNIEKDASYGGTPLKKAIVSNEMQQGSPWTIEFLNRMREKAKLRRQSLPRDLSSLHCVYPTPSSTTKRKSPSAIEYFKYQGGKTPIKLAAQKKQKQGSLLISNSSKREHIPSPSLRSWTPVDKKAKRTLSFGTKGNEGQTELIWRERA